MTDQKSPVTQLFINGEFVNGSHPDTWDVMNPSTEAVIAKMTQANSDDVDKAVTAARKAFEAWGSTTGSERAKHLRAISAELTKRKTHLAMLETTNMGKPLKEAEWDVDDVAYCFSYYADLAEALDKKQLTPVQVPHASFTCHIRYEPIGVAACIIPWNYPLLMAAWKVAPALAAGATIVLKPSELTPLTALELARICQDVQLPPGVLNVITGTGPVTGEPLVNHKDVDKVAFTGSTWTGARIMSSSSKFIRNTTLELGGKSPIIVFDDVELDKAVEWVMFGCFWTNGQICSATSRLLVQESIADRFLARLAEAAKAIPVVDVTAKENLEKTGLLGPVVSKAQHERVLGYINGAVKEGARVIAGGRRPEQHSKGYFIEPTILSVTPSMTVWKEEVFGPVLSVTTFKDEKQAMELAHDTEYGLGGAVLSSNKDVCQRVSKALRAGIVWVNCSQPCFVEAPWGGMKRSGIGRELGPWGLDNYLEVKQITTYTSDQPWSWYTMPPTSSKL